MHHSPAPCRSLRQTLNAGLGTSLVLCLTALPAMAAGGYDCVMDAAKIVHLSARTAGVIASVEVVKGQHVDKGDVIARIDSSMERAALRVLEARSASTAAIDVQTARVAFAKAQLDRAITLERQNAQSQVKVEELQYEFHTATSQLRQAEADLAALKAETERARIAVDNTETRAPLAGVVTDTPLSAGEYATSDRPVAVLAQTDPIHVDAYLPAEMFDKVKPGTPVLIHPEQPAGTVIEAKVLSVDALFDAASRTFGLRVALPNAGNAIVAGQRCLIELAAP